MLAAVATIWILFTVWLLSPHVGISPGAARIVARALTAELVLLLVWSYGTEACGGDGTCAPLAQAAGVAARVDLPILAVVIVAGAVRTTTARRGGGPSELPEKQVGA